MYCSHCGQALQPGQNICAQCGQPSAMATPPAPYFEQDVPSYAHKIHLLSAGWMIYAGVSALLGFAGMSTTHPFFGGGFGDPQGMDRETMGMSIQPALLHFFWIAILVRSALALVAAWGLWERASWGRIAAIVVGCLSLIKMPFGTAMGIWTLVLLVGSRNAALYQRIEQR